ncbi:glycosidase [bacterium C-53]|nr:glycosidase [Lachnospiraceae bacterium]NBI02244.1 glycosidase [Lachnospiraceae bacterium]RKJ11812.1 glycosidase [bacterium C-53]
MTKVIGSALPNIPWQERKEGDNAPVWRFEKNPIIGRDGNKHSNSVFNSAVVPFGNGFAGVFRCDSRSVSMDIFSGRSSDGIHWEIADDPIVFEGADGEILNREYRYDPRVCYLEDRYYITWCNGYHGPTIGVAYTFDFQKFVQLENAFLPYNRNGVLFPRKINGHYMLMSRPSDTGHTPFGDIFVSQSKDMEFWGRHRYMMGAVKGDVSAWQSTKIGPGPVPIETEEGWLLIYHGVLTTCNGYVYRMGCALLDLEEPWKVKKRSRDYILAPYEYYECVGDVPNVTFPCAALCDAPTGRIAIYYGCADTVTGLAFTTVDELIRHMDEYPLT